MEGTSMTESCESVAAVRELLRGFNEGYSKRALSALTLS
jgi:hypothetical protein